MIMRSMDGSSIDDPIETASEHLHVKVDQEADSEIGQLQIGKYLGPMNWDDLLDGFHFDNDGPVDQNIELIAAFQTDPTIFDGQRDLSLEAYSVKR
jgi:hypothetical protein